MTNEKIRLTIDGIEIEAAAETTILAAADAAEIYIPRLCSHPDLPATDPERLEPWSEVWQGPRQVRGKEKGEFTGCGLCLVDVAASSGEETVRACQTPVVNGMSVTTTGSEIDRQRKDVLRQIFIHHPHACVQCAQQAGCSQEPCSTNVDRPERCCSLFHDCELRRVAEFVGIPDDTPRYKPSGAPKVDQEPLFIREHDLCIGCLRCVRMCREIRQIDALGFVLDENGVPVVGTRAETLEASGCQWCLSCVEVCPTGTLRLKMDQPRLDGVRVAPCVTGCPAGIDIPHYLREIRSGEFARAEATVRQMAPLPRVLGQVCFHPCEEVCLRGEIGSEPLAICALKRAAVEHSDGRDSKQADVQKIEPLWRSHLPAVRDTGKKVGIVGAGPTGLSAAWFLRLKGHTVLVYDALPVAGGWLYNGLPKYRLDREALSADVADVASLGVEFKFCVEIGKDLKWQQLRDEHDAVLIATGARRAKRLPCPGVDLPGVQDGLTLLERPATSGEGGSSGGVSLAGETVVVIGGGNVAIDIARTALRLNPAEVHLYCLEERDQMPAHDWEISDATNEGVIVHPGWGPAQITGEGKVEQVDFRKCVSVFDDAGRFAPAFDETVTTGQLADCVLVAIGQDTVLDFLSNVDGIEICGGTIKADNTTLQVAPAGIYAGGEVVSGPASVVDAVAQGRRAAAGIDRSLGGDGDLTFTLLDKTALDNRLDKQTGFTALTRTAHKHLEPAVAVAGFDLIESGYSADDAVAEANRCLRCDLRLALRKNPHPPAPWVEFSAAGVAEVPSVEGVYRLLDENKEVYAIKGVADLHEALSELIDTSDRARFFLFDEDPMFSKRESELIQEYLKQHGCMPPGEDDDDLDDLF